MPNMDYSLIQRTPDGTGKILVTTPGSPDKGSYVLESDMKIYTNQGMVAIADIVDDLVTADAAKPLSANQGVVLKQLIDAFSGGIVPKGDILSSNLPAADASNKGWQYYCTDTNQWATSDGTQWIMTSNNVITQTPDATDTGHALSNAVVTQCCNEVKGKLNQHESRLENLEQVAGDYGTWHYPNDPNHSSDMPNKVPTGKAKYGLVKSIVGKTRAWNLPISTLNYASEVYGITRANAGTGKIRYYGTSTNTTGFTCFSLMTGHPIAGHKYLILLNCELPSGARLNIAGTADRQNSYIGELGLSSYGIEITNGTTVDFIATPVIRDLTPIFPEGVPSTIAECVQKCPDLLKYNAYDAGSLVDTEVSGVESVGVNIWDEEWELGGYNTNTGEKVEINTRIRSKTGFSVLPNTEYFFLFGTGSGNVFFYDRNGNYISRIYFSASNSFTTPSNCFIVKIAMADDYGTTYNHDIQICLNSLPDAIKTTYHSYKTDTLSLPETVTLKSAGSVSDELDVESGVVTRKIGSVDLGTLDWTKREHENLGTYYYASAQDLGIAKPDSYHTGTANLLCAKYVPTKRSETLFTDKSICLDGDVNQVIQIQIKDSAYTDATTFKASLSGVILYYELATPDPSTFIDPILDPFIKVEGGGTINTIQTQTPVIDNCLDVGYLTL